MSKRITFQFEDDLDYQMQAIHSTVELFRGLSTLTYNEAEKLLTLLKDNL
ncbi:MAG: hypothetical protein GX284_07100 [Clostridiales bacterium]|nr:hypothetical protein [Clostridiales bacterium]